MTEKRSKIDKKKKTVLKAFVFVDTLSNLLVFLFNVRNESAFILKFYPFWF